MPSDNPIAVSVEGHVRLRAVVRWPGGNIYQDRCRHLNSARVEAAKDNVAAGGPVGRYAGRVVVRGDGLVSPISWPRDRPGYQCAVRRECASVVSTDDCKLAGRGDGHVRVLLVFCR